MSAEREELVKQLAQADADVERLDLEVTRLRVERQRAGRRWRELAWRLASYDRKHKPTWKVSP